MDTNSLESIGLTKNESLVYLALLKVGTSKTADILKESNLNSGRIYDTLESLKNKGLVSESILNNIRNFTAAPPKQILEYLEEKKKSLKKDEENIKKELPKFENLMKTKGGKVKAVTYIGLRGLKTAADEALESMEKGDKILVMGGTHLKDEKINQFWLNWSPKRAEKKIKTKMLFSEKSKYSKDFSKVCSTKVKYLEGITPVTVDIFGKNKTLILNYKDPLSCIMIHDENTATSFRNFFNQLWKTAKA